MRIATGWRPKTTNNDVPCNRSKHVVKQIKVKDRFVIVSVDVVTEENHYQVLRVWDIVPECDVPKIVDRLDSLFFMYTDEFLGLCKANKRIEGYVVYNHCFYYVLILFL